MGHDKDQFAEEPTSPRRVRVTKGASTGAPGRCPADGYSNLFSAANACSNLASVGSGTGPSRDGLSAK